MKISAKLLLLLFIVLLLPSCAALSSSGDYAREPINWRDYNDC